MKSITFGNLHELGINPLTGEACAFSMRVLCDLNRDGAELVKRYLGLPLSADLHENWNSMVDGKPAVACIMMDRAMFDPLIRFYLFTQGFDCLYGQSCCYTAYTLDELEKNEALKSVHSGAIGSGKLYINPTSYSNAPRNGDRNVHAATGRAS